MMNAAATSQRKQALYGQYARGEMTLDEVTAQVSAVEPPPRPVSRWRRVAGVVVALVGGIVLPQWGAKKD